MIETSGLDYVQIFQSFNMILPHINSPKMSFFDKVKSIFRKKEVVSGDTNHDAVEVVSEDTDNGIDFEQLPVLVEPMNSRTNEPDWLVNEDILRDEARQGKGEWPFIAD